MSFGVSLSLGRSNVVLKVREIICSDLSSSDVENVSV